MAVLLHARLLFAQAILDLCMSDVKAQRDRDSPCRYDLPLQPDLPAIPGRPL
jgi:hypothetical protein